MHWSRPARAPGALYCAPTGDEVNIDAAIVGIGCSKFGRGLPDSQLRLAAVAFKDALADAGLQRSDVDGLSIHLGWPLGVDYDRVAEGFGLDIRYVNQSWLHGRCVTNALQHAALAVSAGLAGVVACVTAVSFTRERGFLGGAGDIEGNRERGGHAWRGPTLWPHRPGGRRRNRHAALHASLRRDERPACRGADRDAQPRTDESACDHERAAYRCGPSVSTDGGRSTATIRLLPDQRRRSRGSHRTWRPRARFAPETCPRNRHARNPFWPRRVHLRPTQSRHQSTVRPPLRQSSDRLRSVYPSRRGARECARLLHL